MNLITILPTPNAVVNPSFTMTNIVCNECGTGCPATVLRTVVVTLQATAAVPSGYGVSSLWSTNYSVSNVVQSTSAALSIGQQVTITITGTVGDCGSQFQVWFDMCDFPPAGWASACGDRKIVINEVQYDPATALPADANGDGVASGTTDEFIEIVNVSVAGPLTSALTQLATLAPGVKALIGFIGFVVALVSLAGLRNFGPVLFYLGLAIFAAVGLVIAGAIMGAVVPMV